MALPALEYCNLERASRLLQCEVDDLIHWWLIGTIELHICLNGKKSILIGQDKTEQHLSVKESFGNMVQQTQDILSSKISKLYETIPFDYDRYPLKSCYHCIAYGLWKVLPSSVTRELPDQKIKLVSEYYFKANLRKESFGLVSHDTGNFYLVFDEIDNPDGLEIDIKNLIITKKYIDRLNPDINTNAQDLPNWVKENSFDDENVNIDDKSEPAIETTRLKTRVSSKVKDALTILLKETNCDTDQPYSLYNILNSLAEKYGYPEDHFKEDTCANWIQEPNPKLGRKKP